MDTAVRVVITLFFIGLVVLGIIFFTIFFVVPAERLAKVSRTPNATSTESAPEFTRAVPPPGGLTLEEIKEFIQSQLPPQPVTEPTPTSGSVATQNEPVIPGDYSPNPLVSVPIAESEVPSGFLVLEVGDGKFRPQAFEVRAGSQVNLAITARDSESHLFVFTHPALADIAVGIGLGQTRTLTFTAPPLAGEFPFRCGVPGHAARGETGVMIVR